jgi:kinesin family protein 3/17
MNDKSSRSHAIFKIQVESTKEVKPGVPKISVGKLNLVDLAGSERQEKTQAQGERLKESAAINKSLMQLGNVILALVKGEKFIPYRDSKLTTLLKDSLGGNSKTTMLANINPCTQHYEESIGTLRYANRTKMIMNKPIVNEDPKDALISEYMNQIQKLKEMIDKGGIAQNSETTMEIDQEMLRKIKEEGIKEKEQALEEMEKMKVKELEKFKEQKEKIEVELKQKENSYEKIKLDKEMLEKLLQEKEQALLQGHQVQEDKSKLEEMRKRIM